MPSHPVDSVLYRDLFGTEEMRAVFADETLVQRWLDVEAALARAEARVGLIPEEAAEEITRRARVELFDLDQLGRELLATTHPIVPLIRGLERLCANGHGQYAHWGATTQDIMDTAIALQIKDAYAILERGLRQLGDAVAQLAETHRDTVMAGRTHGQHAVPLTMGFKAAIWLVELMRHEERLDQARPRVLVGQFAGAVGSLASIGEAGIRVQELMMEELGLGVPLVAWHTARDGIAEFAAAVSLTANTCAKIANEVIALQKPEILELQEPWHAGKVGSSTMPHKRNPMLSEMVVAAARIVRSNAALLADTSLHEHERDWRSLVAEWDALPELCIVAAGSLATITRVVAGLDVDPARMRANLDETRGLIMSERLMMELAPALGREHVHDLVYEASMRAFEERRPLAEVVMEHPELAQAVTGAELERILDPAANTGACAAFVDRALAHFGERPRSDTTG